MGVRNVGHASMTYDTDRTQSPHPEIARDTAAGAQARRAMGEAIVRTQTAKFITDGIALGYRYDPSPICWPDGRPGPAAHHQRISSDLLSGQPGAACLARRGALDHRCLRGRLYASALR